MSIVAHVKYGGLVTSRTVAWFYVLTVTALVVIEDGKKGLARVHAPALTKQWMDETLMVGWALAWIKYGGV